MPDAAKDWFDKPLSEIAAGLRSGDVTSAALFETARANHASHGPALGAYRIWDEARAGKQAKAADDAFASRSDMGLLQGLPVSVKDLYGVDYFDTTAGSPKALPESWNSEGPVIKALRNQGAVITGKTHTVEFAFGGLGTNVHWPIPRNPWDAHDHRAPGGSSSGAGVSLIEGSCLLALGTDTAGSVRVPASLTGTVGLKTTSGRWPLEGIAPLSPTFDTPGVLARTVADAAYAFEAIDAACANRTPRAPVQATDISGLRIGIVERHFWEDCDNGIDQEVRNAISELENAGAKIVPLDLPETDEAFGLFLKGSVVASELSAFLTYQLPDWIGTLDPNIAGRMEAALDLESEEIAERRAAIARLQRSARTRFEDCDVIVTPTVQITPPKIADVVDTDRYRTRNMATLRNTCIANILDLCAITLPVARDTEGMPVGLQLMARGNTEEDLLAAALTVENTLGTGRKRLGKAPLGA